MIILVTGPKNSGKSTYLLNWFENDPKGYGVLSMKRFKNNIHCGYDLIFLPSGKKLNLCNRYSVNDQIKDNDLIQGNYIFNQYAFDQAYSYITENITMSSLPIWLDEVGLLEIKGKGFMPTIRKIQHLNIEMRIGVRLSCVYEFARMIGNKNQFHIIYATSG